MDTTPERATWDKHRAAQYLDISPHTLDQDVSSKTLGIPYVKIGRLRRYLKADLDRWLADRTVFNQSKSARAA